jgi:hypothetical protein
VFWGGHDRPGRLSLRRLRHDRRRVCGMNAERLEVLNEVWEAACFVEECADWFAATGCN